MLIPIKNNYICDTQTGVLLKDNLLDEYNKLPEDVINRLKTLRYARKENNMQSRDKKLTSIKLWGFGLLTCIGTCDYCYRHLEDASNPDIKCEQPVSAEYIDKVMKEISEFRDDDTYISFFGSTIFLHPEKNKIIETLKANNKEYLTIGFVNDMMLSEGSFCKSMDFMEEVANDPFVKTVLLYITLDLGSTSRNSKHLCIDNEEIIQRGRRIVERFKDNKKVCIVFKSNFGSLTDMDKFKQDVEEFSKLPCVLMFSPVSHDKYEPSLEMMEEVIKYIGERKTYVMFRGEILFDTGDISQDFLNRFKPSVPQMRRASHEMFVDNAIITCQAYSTMISIRNNTTSACCYDYLSEHDNAVDSFVLDYENPDQDMDKKKLTELPEECLKCDNIGICGQCMPRRHVFKCAEHPALMRWETYIWERRCNDFIETLIPYKH